MIRSERPLVGVGFRQPLEDWILSHPTAVECLEITAEHFFDDSSPLLERISATYPVFVHGLGLSLGTPGPLDEETLRRFHQVVQRADPEWISEHIAFTRTNDVDLGHLNPLAPNRAGLQVLVDHAKELADRCSKPLILENITTFLAIRGDMSEPEFLNQLCDQAQCGLLLDVTNLWINSRNHSFDPMQWLEQLEPQNVVQLHVVGYSERDGVYFDRHADPIQDELFELVAEVMRRTAVKAVIIERDAAIPPPEELAMELTRLSQLAP